MGSNTIVIIIIKIKKTKDEQKNNFLKSYDISIIRIRQHPLRKISKNDLIVYKYDLGKNDLNNIVKINNEFLFRMIN